jgi:hypothetical protein
MGEDMLKVQAGGVMPESGEPGVAASPERTGPEQAANVTCEQSSAAIGRSSSIATVR